MKRFARRAVVLAAALLGGCASNYEPGTPYHFAEVNVTTANSEIGSPTLAPNLREGLRTVTDLQPSTGAAKRLDVVVTSYSKANPAMSFLVASANSMAASVTITGDDGEEFTSNVITQTNAGAGVIGAVMAARESQDAAELSTSVAMSNRILKSVYGGEIPQRRRAFVPQTASVPAPAVAAPRPQSAPAPARAVPTS